MNIYFILVEAVEQKKEKLRGLHSDVPYILALAKVSMVRLLVSYDKKLHADFKEIAKGNFFKIKIINVFLGKTLAPNFATPILG